MSWLPVFALFEGNTCYAWHQRWDSYPIISYSESAIKEETLHVSTTNVQSLILQRSHVLKNWVAVQYSSSSFSVIQSYSVTPARLSGPCKKNVPSLAEKRNKYQYESRWNGRGRLSRKKRKNVECNDILSHNADLIIGTVPFNT